MKPTKVICALALFFGIALASSAETEKVAQWNADIAALEVGNALRGKVRGKMEEVIEENPPFGKCQDIWQTCSDGCVCIPHRGMCDDLDTCVETLPYDI